MLMSLTYGPFALMLMQGDGILNGTNQGKLKYLGQFLVGGVQNGDIEVAEEEQPTTSQVLVNEAQFGSG